MKQSASFEMEIHGTHFTFARVCTDDGRCDQFSVMAEDHILRMNRDKDELDYSILDKHIMPAKILAIEAELSEAIRNYEANEAGNSF